MYHAFNDYKIKNMLKVKFIEISKEFKDIVNAINKENSDLKKYKDKYWFKWWNFRK